MPGSTMATGPFVSIPSPAATYIRIRNSRRRSGKRSLSAKNTSVSDMKAVIQMSMKMRRPSITNRGSDARPTAASKAAPRPAGPSWFAAIRPSTAPHAMITMAPSAIVKRSTPTDTPNAW